MLGKIIPKLPQLMSGMQMDFSQIMGRLPAQFSGLSGLLQKATQFPSEALRAQLGAATAKLAFICALHESIEKAQNSNSFNVETAINDLWVKLDGVRGFQRPGQQVDTEKLLRMTQKQAEMFQMLGNIMKSYDETAKAAIQSIR